jgi:hypothetical protein
MAACRARRNISAGDLHALLPQLGHQCGVRPGVEREAAQFHSRRSRQRRHLDFVGTALSAKRG